MDLTNAVLEQISVHAVGNKGNGQELKTSKKTLSLTEQEKNNVAEAFLARFNTEQDKYSFHHPSSLQYNEVFNYCLEIMSDDLPFHKGTTQIAKQLYESSTHPKIKPGELYVCYFSNCIVDNKPHDAIGIYKTESKSRFLDLEIDNDFRLNMREGVELSKMDKGALVLSSNAEEGFDVLVFDNNRGEEAIFWTESFLSIVPQATEYYNTNQVMTVARQFIEKQIPQEYEVGKTEQIEYLNRSLDFFRSNNEFDKKKFEKDVFGESGLIKSYRNFEQSYAEENDIDFADNFSISSQALKKQTRVYKSVLKLDKNFHVYIHGNTDLIEKGYDSAVGKNFYKIYFDEEL
jgi:hypothetical protein